MSKKIILLSAIVMCTFIYGCGAQKDIDDQQSGTDNNSGINETIEIPVAEKVDGEAIIMEGDRNDEAVEINENFEEAI